MRGINKGVKRSLTIHELREHVLGLKQMVVTPKQRPDLLNFLGTSKKNRENNLAQKIIRSTSKKADILRKNRGDIFAYIIDFWERSIFSIPYKTYTHKGLNLSKRPFLSPSGPKKGNAFGFYEQYRWDTYFQNHGFILTGGYYIAINQLLNFSHVFF